MKAFYPLLNFSEGPIFFGADKSSFHITLLKGTAVKTSKEKYTPQGSFASGVNKHKSTPSIKSPTSGTCLLFLPRTSGQQHTWVWAGVGKRQAGLSGHSLLLASGHSLPPDHLEGQGMTTVDWRIPAMGLPSVP